MSCKNLPNILHLPEKKYHRWQKLGTNGHPQLANMVINQANNLKKNLKITAQNYTPKNYEYNDLGTMATIGINKAVADLQFLKMTGFFAWLILDVFTLNAYFKCSKQIDNFYKLGLGIYYKRHCIATDT